MPTSAVQFRCAHYAVVAGVVYDASTDTESEESVVDSRAIQWEKTNVSTSRTTPGDVHIVYQHSASRRVVAVPWQTLVDSNAQLVSEILTKSRWVVPEGGPTLIGKCLQFTFARPGNESKK